MLKAEFSAAIRSCLTRCSAGLFNKAKMPIYEFECTACGRIASHVLMGAERDRRPECSTCGSKTRRVMSSFAMVESEASRLARFDPSRRNDESFYRDSRNVGLWAKKKAQQMGVDLGPKFEETVEKARSGKLIKDLPDNG
jgi:putative FmdB family regulatory protein